ncbi:Lactonase, 7-bladed beta-propeller-domain-containing protein [Xylariales sp. AK1849]|nr:Lactonase, 7-bladed beta-propeller-domain-containing protein [Xylariales sp. AK1849]
MAPLTSTLLTGLEAARLLVSHFSGQIYSLSLTLNNSTSSGTLAITSEASGCGQIPTWLHLEESTRTVYCFDEDWNGSGVISQYSIDSSSTLALTGSAKTPGNSVYGSLYGGPDGRSFVVTSEYSPSTITTYKLPLTNDTTPIQTLEFTMDAPGPRPDRQDRPHPHSAFTDPSGTFLLVPDLGADLTRIFTIDSDSGILTACPAISSNPGDGPRHGLFKEVDEGLKYYSLNEVSSSIGIYDVVYPTANTSCLSLTLVQTDSTYGPGRLGNVTEKSAELRIAGDFLYASNRNDTSFGFEQDSLATFTISPSDGALSFVELSSSYGYFPRSFDINKAGTYVAVGGQTTANVAIIERDPATGRLGGLVANITIPPRGTYGGEDGLSSVVWDE